jgi:hypothetical protein
MGFPRGVIAWILDRLALIAKPGDAPTPFDLWGPCRFYRPEARLLGYIAEREWVSEHSPKLPASIGA